MYIHEKFWVGKSMFQENEGGLEVGAKIHNTNVRTLRALQHNYIAGSGGGGGGGEMPPLKPPKKNPAYIYEFVFLFLVIQVLMTKLMRYKMHLLSNYIYNI